MKHQTPIKRFTILTLAVLSGWQANAQCSGTTPAEYDCSGCTEAVSNGVADATTTCVSSSKTFAGYSVNNGGRLVVCGGATLTVTGSMNLNGGEVVINSGATLDHSSSMSLGGTFDIAVWGTFNRSDYINVNGGTIYVEGALDMNTTNMSLGGGSLIIRENATVTAIDDFTGNSGGICMENSSSMEIQGNFGNNVSNILSFGGSGGACVGWSSTANSMNSNLTSSSNFTLCKMSGASDITNGREGSATIEDPCTSCGAFLLPVEISDFSLSHTTQGVYLTWSTASETNNDFFTIQTSIDGENFIDVATVIGAGTSSTVVDYEFFDPNADQSQIVYYRIMQTDFNGDVSYSGIGSLLPEMKTKAQIRLVQNSGLLQLKGVAFDSNSPINFSIRDLKGSTVHRSSLLANEFNAFNNDLSRLGINAGMYVFSVFQNDQIVSKRFVIR